MPSSNMFDLGYGCGGREPGGPVQPSSIPPLQECSRQALTEINVRCRGFVHRIRAQEAGGNALPWLRTGCSLTYWK